MLASTPPGITLQPLPPVGAIAPAFQLGAPRRNVLSRHRDEIRIAIGDGNIISVVSLRPSCVDRPSRAQPHPRSGITAAPARAKKNFSERDCCSVDAHACP